MPYTTAQVIIVHTRELRTRALVFALFVRDSVQAGMRTVADVRMCVSAHMGARMRVFSVES